MRSKTGTCVYETEALELRPTFRCVTLPVSVTGELPLVSHQSIAARGTLRLHTLLRNSGNLQPRPSGHNLSTVYDTSASVSPKTCGSHSSFELEAMKARIAELEEKLSHAGSSMAPFPYQAKVSRPTTYPVQTVTSFAGTIDVLQDSQSIEHSQVISRSIAHKNRVFGQSHWMNGFVIFREIVEVMEPYLRGGSTNVLGNIYRAKALARVIKSKRSPAWPTVPTKDLPPRHVCDALVDNYLRTMELLYRVVHIPNFRREYEALWTTGNEPSISFVIQLKLILAIGTTIYDETFSMRPDAIRWIYEAQTWCSSPVFKSRLSIGYLQTSILLLLARDVVDVGSELVWISAGSVFRAAVYIGLHKDPVRLPKMSLFDAEMRRRIWNTILEVSLQASLESGGPCFISMDDFDTEPPGNFDDDQLTAPDLAPKTDDCHTQAAISVALRKAFPARLSVVKFLNDIASTGTYEETLRIDTQLRAAYKSLRRTLQVCIANTPSSKCGSLVDSADFIMQRYISSLHLPFFGTSLHDHIYAFSRKAVVDSSLKIWKLAHPQTPLAGSTETDLARLCRCGAGFFRTFSFHASTFLGVEALTQIEDDDEILSSQICLGTILDDAAHWYLRVMQTGETSMKGYMLLRLIGTQLDAARQCVDKSELPGLLMQAAEEATHTCLPILESLVSDDLDSSAPTDVDGFDSLLSPEFAEDWDLVMSDVFNSGGAESLDLFF